MAVARNVVFNPRLAPGGGATEMAISVQLHNKAKTITGIESGPYKAVADAMEVIPRTLVQNAGGNAIRVLTELRVRWICRYIEGCRLTLPQAKHANGEHSWGIDGDTGKLVDMKTYGLYESASVKVMMCTGSHRGVLTPLLLIDPNSQNGNRSRKSSSAGG
jgi:T-complex protein 1 subunit gamma